MRSGCDSHRGVRTLIAAASRAVFEKAAKGIERNLQDCLEQFRNQITVGLGDVVQFEVLQRMQPGDESMVQPAQSPRIA